MFETKCRKSAAAGYVSCTNVKLCGLRKAYTRTLARGAQAVTGLSPSLALPARGREHEKLLVIKDPSRRHFGLLLILIFVPLKFFSFFWWD
jgi:hypothetical protein